MDRLAIGEWQATRSTGQLQGAGRRVSVEPKVMDLLWCLAAHGTAVVPRETLVATLWSGRVVTEDALARTVSKLRQALGDTGRAPTYVGTVPKRGYRLLVPAVPLPAGGTRVDAPVESDAAVAAVEPPRRGPLWLALAAGLAAVAVAVAILGPPSRVNAAPALAAHAADAYFQYTYADNESAIALYERLLAQRPDYAQAHAGLANALVQRALRWPDGAAPGVPVYTTLRAALAAGRLGQPAASATLARALGHASAAVALAPRDAVAHRALGLVHSAHGDLERALACYDRALALDPEEWGTLVNRGDVVDLLGRPREAVASLEAAHAAMWRRYSEEPARIRPWYAALGIAVGDRQLALGERAAAGAAYRRVLAFAPAHALATARLAALGPHT